MYLFRTPPLGWGRETILKRVSLAEEAARPDDTTEAFCSIPRCGSSRTPAVTCLFGAGEGAAGLYVPLRPEEATFRQGYSGSTLRFGAWVCVAAGACSRHGGSLGGVLVDGLVRLPVAGL